MPRSRSLADLVGQNRTPTPIIQGAPAQIAQAPGGFAKPSVVGSAIKEELVGVAGQKLDEEFDISGKLKKFIGGSSSGGSSSSGSGK